MEFPTSKKDSRELVTDIAYASAELGARAIEHDIDKSKLAAYEETVKRQGEAHDFCKNVFRAIGKNVWHVVLDEAIRLRAENEALKNRPASYEAAILSKRGHTHITHSCFVPTGGGGYGSTGGPK